MVGTKNSLNVAFKTGDQATICSAISALIHGTNNVSAFALKVGVDRTTLYRAFKHNNPKLEVLLKMVRAAGLALVVVDDPDHRSKPSLIAERINRAFATAEITQIVNAFGQTLRDQENVVLFAEETTVARSTLYRAFTAPRVPKLKTVLCFLNALGLRLAVNPLPNPAQNRD